MEKWWIQGQIRDEGRCAYCGFDLYSSFQAYYSAQADHLIPQKVLSDPAFTDVLRNHDVFRDEAVHLDAVGNCVTACVFCNQHKKAWLPDGWEQMTREQMIASNSRRLDTRRTSHEQEYRRRFRLIAQARDEIS